MTRDAAAITALVGFTSHKDGCGIDFCSECNHYDSDTPLHAKSFGHEFKSACTCGLADTLSALGGTHKGYCRSLVPWDERTNPVVEACNCGALGGTAELIRDLSAALVQAEQQYDTAQHNVLAYLERNHDLEDRLQAQEATIRQVVEELRAEFLFKWADTLATLLPAEQTGEQ